MTIELIRRLQWPTVGVAADEEQGSSLRPKGTNKVIGSFRPNADMIARFSSAFRFKASRLPQRNGLRSWRVTTTFPVRRLGLRANKKQDRKP